MKTLTLGAALLVIAAVTAAAQVPAPAPNPQQAFEAGQYDQALQTIAQMREGGADPITHAFLAGQVQLRRSQPDAARAEFARLVESGDDIWRQVGESSIAAIDQNIDHALAVATQAAAQVNERHAQAAAEAGGQLPPQDPGAQVRDFATFYQLGLVKSRREDWAGAAEAFDRATQLNPTFAYAHYYAGLAYSRMRRPDQVGARFEVFLKLAPTAPERGAVTAMMRTLRGA